jgi:hypothetical protein
MKHPRHWMTSAFGDDRRATPAAAPSSSAAGAFGSVLMLATTLILFQLLSQPAQHPIQTIDRRLGKPRHFRISAVVFQA